LIFFKKKFLLLPKVILRYDNQIELSYEIKFINFLNFISKKLEIQICSSKKHKNFDAIIISGGNDVYNKSLKKIDLIRKKYVDLYYNKAIKKKIPIIAFCYGAQYIADKFKLKLVKRNNHLIKHNITSADPKNILRVKNKRKVNSYHKFCILSAGKNFLPIYKSKDDSIECLFSKKKKILAIMWHPERQRCFSIEDKKLIFNFLKLCNF
jgi:gamma-glutamyl-gamma-aminobutyrate hydrolase PuuD